MNENLQNALQSIITEAVSTAHGAKDFILAQAPDVVQQLVAYNRVSAAIGAIIAGSIAVIPGLLVRKYWDELEEDDASVVCTVGAIVVGMISFIICISYGGDFLKWWLAPKVALLEYVAHLVK